MFAGPRNRIRQYKDYKAGEGVLANQIIVSYRRFLESPLHSLIESKTY